MSKKLGQEPAFPLTDGKTWKHVKSIELLKQENED